MELMADRSSLFRKIPARLAHQWGVLPLKKNADGTIDVAMADAGNLDFIEDLRIVLGGRVNPVPVPADELTDLIDQHYGLGAGEIEENTMAPFVNRLILHALQNRATDIHIEPDEDSLSIRLRIDGVLHPIPVPESLAKTKDLLFARIKVMGQMNIAEKRRPQDGRIPFHARGTAVDIRVSIIPTINGESLDLRLLPKTQSLKNLSSLGMNAGLTDALHRLIHRPNGILLVTGPTGHGKTTTLYTCLSRINTPEKKIITIEDPVEIRLPGVNQIQAHPKINLTFAEGLRSILRQDPDVIMVGEIRDSETAEIAIRSSLTGHLVFSTLHTNDAAGAVTRLLDMGIEPYLVASSINAVLAQRLVRTVCPYCRGRAESCTACRKTGFRGRTGIFELLVIDDDIRELILKGAPARDIRRAAAENGMVPLVKDGLQKSSDGVTTPEEVSRVAVEE